MCMAPGLTEVRPRALTSFPSHATLFPSPTRHRDGAGDCTGAAACSQWRGHAVARTARSGGLEAAGCCRAGGGELQPPCKPPLQAPPLLAFSPPWPNGRGVLLSRRLTRRRPTWRRACLSVQLPPPLPAPPQRGIPPSEHRGEVRASGSAGGEGDAAFCPLFPRCGPAESPFHFFILATRSSALPLVAVLHGRVGVILSTARGARGASRLAFPSMTASWGGYGVQEVVGWGGRGRG